MSRKARRKWERHPAAFKQRAVERMKQGHVRNLAKELGVSVSMLYRWKQRAQEQAAPEAGEDPRERRVRALEKKVKEQIEQSGETTLRLPRPLGHRLDPPMRLCKPGDDQARFRELRLAEKNGSSGVQRKG